MRDFSSFLCVILKCIVGRQKRTGLGVECFWFTTSLSFRYSGIIIRNRKIKNTIMLTPITSTQKGLTHRGRSHFSSLSKVKSLCFFLKSGLINLIWRAPVWLNRLSFWLLVSAQVMISLFMSLWADSMEPAWDSFSLSLSLSLSLSHHPLLVVFYLSVSK